MKKIITKIKQINFGKYRLHMVSAVTILLLVAMAIIFVNMPKPTKYNVVLTDSGFVPNRLTIKKGDLVKFTTTTDSSFWPASDPHPLHTLYPQFDPKKPIAANGSW